MVIEHRHHSASARTNRQGALLHIDFFGPICQKSSDSLCRQLLPDRLGMAVSLERLDAALTLYTSPIKFDPLNYPYWTPPSAVVVRPDQFEAEKEFCHQLALMGLIRVPFLVSQLDWAHAFVARVAARQSQGRPRRR